MTSGLLHSRMSSGTGLVGYLAFLSFLRGIKAWVSEHFLIIIFMMGGTSVSIVTTDHHMILLSYYELLKNHKIRIRLTCVYYPSPASVLERYSPCTL